MEVEGHAGAGEYGKDPVCAAVSTLVLTLLENVPGRAGYGSARCEGGGREAYEVIWRGFRVLEEICPDNVRCERIEYEKGGAYGKRQASAVR